MYRNYLGIFVDFRRILTECGIATWWMGCGIVEYSVIKNGFVCDVTYSHRRVHL